MNFRHVRANFMPFVTNLPKPPTSYAPISVRTLRPDQSIGISLYLRGSEAGSHFLYRDKDIPLNESDLQSLQSRGLTMLYAKSNEVEIYQQYLRGTLDSVLADESVPVVNRFSHLNEVIRNVLADSFRRGDTTEA